LVECSPGLSYDGMLHSSWMDHIYSYHISREARIESLTYLHIRLNRMH